MRSRTVRRACSGVIGMVLLLAIGSVMSPKEQAVERELLGLSIVDNLDGTGCGADSTLGVYGLPLWVLIMSWFILGVSIVCEEYFVVAIEQITEKLDIPGNAAGATLLAAGSSFPELFAALIGTVFHSSEDNPGPGTIVGSAVFNITIIIAMVGIFLPGHVRLNKIAVARDCGAYLVSGMTLWFFYSVTSPGFISMIEASCMVLLYVLYVVVVFRTSSLARRLGFAELHDEDGESQRSLSGSLSAIVREHIDTPEPSPTDYSPFSEGISPMEIESNHIQTKSRSRTTSVVRSDRSFGKRLFDTLSYPWVRAFEMTVPSPRRISDSGIASRVELTRYLSVLFISIIWIAFITFCMIDFAEKAGACLQMNAAVMGYTVLAIGTSLPDALSSIVVARSGRGNMAVCNAIGSNVFDILFAMGLPWFLQSLFTKKSVRVNQDDSYVFLFGMGVSLIGFLGVIVMKDFTLNKSTSGLLFIVYLAAMVVAMYLEFRMQ